MENVKHKHLAVLDEAARRGEQDTGNMRLCFEVLALAAAIDRSCAARLAPYRLSEGKFVLLSLLRDLPDGLAPYELAERAGVTRATITGLLDGLERDGFLLRHGDKDDRRKISVRLTSMGKAMAEDLFVEHSQWIGSLFAGFEPREREVFSGFLLRAWRNVEMPLDAGQATGAGTSP